MQKLFLLTLIMFKYTSVHIDIDNPIQKARGYMLTMITIDIASHKLVVQ